MLVECIWELVRLLYCVSACRYHYVPFHVNKQTVAVLLLCILPAGEHSCMQASVLQAVHHRMTIYDNMVARGPASMRVFIFLFLSAQQDILPLTVASMDLCEYIYRMFKHNGLVVHRRWALVYPTCFAQRGLFYDYDNTRQGSVPIPWCR